METITIPAGLRAQEMEIFWDHDDLYVMVEGHRYRFNELPEKLWLKVAAVLQDDEPALRLLREQGPRDLKEQVWLYAKCRFGGYNHEADLCLVNSRTPDHEAWNCGKQCKCILKPVLRGKVPAENGSLTAHDIQVMRELLTEGCHIGSVVAERLGLSLSGLDKAKRRLYHKCGVQSIQELGLWALQKGML